MAIFDLGIFNPIFPDQQGGGPIDVTRLPGSRGKLVIYNDSAVTIQIIVSNYTKRILAGMVDMLDLMAVTVPISEVRWKQDIILSNAGQAPISVVAIDGYTPDEVVSMRLPMAIPRLANVGNTVPVTGQSQTLINDGNPPATLVIEMTPIDQPGASALQIYNDGSMLFKLLSAGLQRTLLQLIRGDFGATKAQFILGDVNDVSLTILHGTADNASQAGQAQTANTAQVANSIQVYDGSLSDIKSVTEFQNLTDPTSYAVPSFGDRWYAG